jgi:large subunit ribosomal protein L4e
MSRIARIKGPGIRAMLAPGTVGGRQAHPPVVEKKIIKRIPRKEMRFAICSAIAATASKKIVTDRGHITDDVFNFPLVVVNDIQSLKKANEVKDSFIQFGVWPDVERVRKSRKVRAGRGKMRGRKMKRAIGPLLVIAENRGIIQAARNIPGVDAVKLKSLNVELLAPGTHPGRLTVWTSSTIEKLDEFFGRGYH